MNPNCSPCVKVVTYFATNPKVLHNNDANPNEFNPTKTTHTAQEYSAA